MSKRQYDLLSLSVLILSLGFCSALVAIDMIKLIEVAPLVTAFMGLWLMVISIIQRSESESLVFSIFSWGLLLLVGGVMGFLYSRNLYNAFFIPMILIVLGLIGVVAVIRSRSRIG